MVQLIECNYIVEHTHEYPNDWVFGGADELHAAADPRYESTSYQYYTAMMRLCHTTSQPQCDMEAVDYFTFVAHFSDPVYVTVKRPGENKYSVLKWQYTKATDEVEQIS